MCVKFYRGQSPDLGFGTVGQSLRPAGRVKAEERSVP